MNKNAKERLLRDELERILGLVDNPRRLKIAYGIKLGEKIIQHKDLLEKMQEELAKKRYAPYIELEEEFDIEGMVTFLATRVDPICFFFRQVDRCFEGSRRYWKKVELGFKQDMVKTYQVSIRKLAGNKRFIEERTRPIEHEGDIGICCWNKKTGKLEFLY